MSQRANRQFVLRLLDVAGAVCGERGDLVVGGGGEFDRPIGDAGAVR